MLDSYKKQPETAKSEAIENYTLANEKARPFFGARHRDRRFAIDDLVLSKAGGGRRGKLNPRFGVPFRIIPFDKDIHLVEKIGNPKVVIHR